MRQNLSAQVSDFFNSIDNQDEALLENTFYVLENIDVSKGKYVPKVTVVVLNLDFWNAILDSPQL